MKVLLTGAAGFIGSAIHRRLTALDVEVVGVDLMLPLAHGVADPPPGIHRLDVRDVERWAGLLAGVDVVCHQAAVVGAGVTVADLPLYASHNDLGTAALLAAMSAVGVSRIVFASSMVVYGEGRYRCPVHGERTPGPRARTALERSEFENLCDLCGEPLGWHLIDEDARLDPRSAYAASKVAQEHYAAVWARQSDGAAVALRYHNVYGPGMPRDTPYSGVAAMFRSSVERGEPAQVFEDGLQMRDFVHVDDVARANLAAIDAVRAAAGFAAYNVASGHPVSIAAVARAVAAGAEPQITGRYRLGDVRHIVASPDKAARELGFRAAILPERGLAAFATDPLRPAVTGP